MPYLLTGLGDLAGASCVAVVVLVWTWLRIGRRPALTFGACYLAVFGVATLLKVLARAHLPRLEQVAFWQLTNGAPSGHAVLSTMVYGAILVLFVRLGAGAMRILGVASCLTVIEVVCVTRIILGAHSGGDVVAGLLIAIPGVALFSRSLDSQGPVPPGSLLQLALLAGAVAVAALMTGIRISSLQFI